MTPSWLARATVFAAVAGSHAHGTAKEGSDVDVRGVCVAPLDVRVGLFDRFEQHEGALEGELFDLLSGALGSRADVARSLSVKGEIVLFDVAKFLTLAAATNPSALEILFTDPRDWLLRTSTWEKIHAARYLFLTKHVGRTFQGYAAAQLKKIRTHRGWLLSPPEARPRREDFGLSAGQGPLGADERRRIEAAIAEVVGRTSIADLDVPEGTRAAIEERIRVFCMNVAGAPGDEAGEAERRAATKVLGLSREVVATLEAERAYRSALSQYAAYEAWKTQRNPARAELERRFGYDTKHAMHLVRISRMAVEALLEGELRVRRADADELRDIREGAYAFAELERLAADLSARTAAAMARTALPSEVDRDAVDRLARGIMLDAGHARQNA
ncbi:MAG: nucleotidyltransferase domain-containing protein [Myxococcales bacterium]|nr:nucleotidyltransferase domain-containing protein [Myxococcales bacterium]